MTVSMFYELQTFLGRQGKYLEAQKVKASADRKEMKQLQSTTERASSKGKTTNRDDKLTSACCTNTG